MRMKVVIRVGGRYRGEQRVNHETAKKDNKEKTCTMR
jgi:hypothetical protein